MTSLILLSGENEAELASRRDQAYAIAADRLGAPVVLGGWGKKFRRLARKGVRAYTAPVRWGARKYVGAHASAYRLARNRTARLHGEEEVLLGRSFLGRMARRTKNLAKQGTHIALQTARAAKQVSSGDIAGALSRVGSTISNVTGSGAGSSLESAAAEMQGGQKTGIFSGWKGIALTGGGLVSVVLVVVLLLKRKG